MKHELIGLATTLGITTGAWYVADSRGAFENEHISYDEKLAQLNITDAELKALKNIPPQLLEAESSLQYLAPNAKCNTAFGFSTGCDPEKFPDVAASLNKIDSSIKLLSTARDAAEATATLNQIRESLNPQDSKNPLGEPVNSSTYVRQRLALHTVREETQATSQSYDQRLAQIVEPKPDKISVVSGTVAIFSSLGAIGYSIATARAIKKRFFKKQTPVSA